MARSFIPHLLVFQILLVPGILASNKRGHQTCSQVCKAAPGTPKWPPEDDWAHLAQAVDDKLLTVPPPGAVCHQDQPTYNNASCTEVQSEWTAQAFQSYNPVSLMYGANNASCLPVPSQPCYPLGFPAYVINASTSSHVQQGVRFAKQHNVRLSIRGGGHDLHGQSSAAGALEIWLSSMQDFQHHNSFQPKGCSITIEGSAATVGAGIRMINLTRALDAFNETFPAGGGETISIGGYASSAGHSILCQRTGLAADNVLEMEMVSPAGEILTLNECQNTDLFWAARGGGGSTFGAVTSYTIKTFPTLPVITQTIVISISQGDTLAYDIAAYVMSQFPYFETQGITAYVITEKSPSTIVSFIPHIQGNYTEDDLTTLITPTLQHINETWPQATSTVASSKVYPSFYEWYLKSHDTSPVGVTVFLGSRLLGTAALTTNLTAVAKAFEILSGADIGVTETYLISGKGVWNAKPRGGGNSVCPAWRKTLTQNVGLRTYTPNNSTAEAEAITLIQSQMQGLRDLAPDMGVYQNEGLAFEPDWQHQFWGDNYERLLKIKRKVDPDDVFWCNPCVGNERWEQVGYQLCRVE